MFNPRRKSRTKHYPRNHTRVYYEYSCCVEYLKMIRREIVSKKNRNKFVLLTFDKADPNGLVCPPLEDCLKMVANEVGFELIDEQINGDKYTYTLISTL